MDWTFELTCSGGMDRLGDATSWINRAAGGWTALPGLSALDIYAQVADRARDPFNDDGPGPLFIAMLAFPSRAALRAAIDGADFGLSLGTRPPGLKWTGAAFERHFYSVGGQPAPLTAPFSYVVRYHKPAEDAAAFTKNYVDTHPPTLATLPGIRSVMCYFPQDIVATGLPDAGYLIGNEVAFDSVEAFNLAMQSPVRQ
jgi:uncharacterized protein (TIGR02118 family)